MVQLLRLLEIREKRAFCFNQPYDISPIIGIILVITGLVKSPRIKHLKLSLAIVCFLSGSSAFAQTNANSSGLPGDNFDLYGALELFKKAGSSENFEKALNSGANDVNHLDLDADGKTDYVRVVDREDTAHTLVLQIAVSASEIQEVAVIETEKAGKNNTHMQIVGNEELYGKNYIIESETEAEIVIAENTGSHIAVGESDDDDVYATSDKSGYTYIDLETIEPVVTKIGNGIGYFMVDIMGPVLKDALHAMFKSMIEEAIPILKTD